MIGLVFWVVFGLIVGVVARALMPGEQRMGLIKTTLLGVGGSFVGGTLAHVLFHGRHYGTDTAGFVGSVVGALVILFVASLIGGRNRV